MRLIRQLDDEISDLEERFGVLFEKADPAGIVIAAPGVGPIQAGRGTLDMPLIS